MTDDLPAAQAYREHGDALWRYVRRRVPDSDVDDVVSDIFLVLAKGKPVPVGEGALPWLYAVAYRVVQKHRSGSGRTRRLQHRLSSTYTVSPPPDPADLASSSAWLGALLDRLRPEDAELLRLVVFEDLTVAAAAATLGVSAGSAHTRLHRIRRKVQPWITSESASPATDHHTAHALKEF